MADNKDNQEDGGSDYFAAPSKKEYFLSEGAAQQLQKGYNHRHAASVTKYLFTGLVAFFSVISLVCFVLLVLSYQSETREKVFDIMTALL